MKYYKTWQDALRDYIELFGHNYKDGHKLIVGFEEQLGRNLKGGYYLLGNDHN